jgi:oligopeptide/dipeptide ABC transporter ATP-binding protein
VTGPLLELRELCVHFPRGRRPLLGLAREVLRAVDGVTLEIERGQSLGLVGESGSGKSSVARAIVGLVPIASGAVLQDGVDVRTLRGRGAREARARVLMLHQDPYASLDPRRTALESVVEPLAIHRRFKPRERRLRALVLMDAVGLDPAHAARFPHEFSGGQRQRIALARALALEPELVVLDEPTSSLDVSVQAQVVGVLADLQQRFGLSYLFISHDLALVRHLCPRVAVMYCGRIVESAPCAELFTAPAHPYTRMLLACAPLADPALERARPLPRIQGEAPSAARPPSGCPFHPRCPERDRVAGDRCARERPALEGGARRVACFLGDRA